MLDIELSHEGIFTVLSNEREGLVEGCIVQGVVLLGDIVIDRGTMRERQVHNYAPHAIFLWDEPKGENGRFGMGGSVKGPAALPRRTSFAKASETAWD